MVSVLRLLKPSKRTSRHAEVSQLSVHLSSNLTYLSSDHLAEENKDDYTRWVNHFCPDLVKDDIVAELSDGIKLLTLFNSLTGNDLVRRYCYALQTLVLTLAIDSDLKRVVPCTTRR